MSSKPTYNLIFPSVADEMTYTLPECTVIIRKTLISQKLKRKLTPYLLESRNNTQAWNIALKTKERKCEECEITIALHIHHLNQNPCDNRPENLKILCANC